MWADNADKDDDINNIDDDDDNIDWGCTDQSILGRTMWADDDDKDGDVEVLMANIELLVNSTVKTTMSRRKVPEKYFHINLKPRWRTLRET